MFDEVQLVLFAAWPTVLSIGIVLTSLIIWRGVATAQPDVWEQREQPPRGVLNEPRPGPELPPWRGVRH